MDLFTTAEQWPGATTKAKKSLMQMNLSSSCITKIKEAAKLLEVPVASPVWDGDATAHLGFPNQKVVIFLIQGTENETIATARAEWEVRGYRLLGADKKKIQRASVNEIAATLRTFLTKGN